MYFRLDLLTGLRAAPARCRIALGLSGPTDRRRLADAERRTARKYASPRLQIPSRRSLPPELCCFGVNPKAADHLATVGKLFPIPHGDHQRGGNDRSNSAQLLQPLGDRTFAGPTWQTQLVTCCRKVPRCPLAPLNCS